LSYGAVSNFNFSVVSDMFAAVIFTAGEEE